MPDIFARLGELSRRTPEKSRRRLETGPGEDDDGVLVEPVESIPETPERVAGSDQPVLPERHRMILEDPTGIDQPPA